MMRFPPLFPFDPSIDSPLEHRHLILAYLAVLSVQIGYLGFLIRRFVLARRADWQLRRDPRS
jgi:hypothetical protein